MKNKYKIAMCVFYLVIGLAASVILTNLVNSAFMHIPIDLSPEPFVWISGVFVNGQSIKLFGIFMMLVLLLCVMYFFCSQKPYEADLITITPKIKIPAPSGQAQHGSASFMTEEQKRRKFNELVLSSSSPEVKKLLDEGERRAAAVDNGQTYTPNKLKIENLFDEAGIVSKAAINSEFDGSSLILYDSEEIESANAVMQQYAEELRSIGTESEFQQYIAAFDDTDISFSDITDVHFREDSNLNKISEYKDGVKRFLYTRAMETMPKYEYLYEETVTEDKRPCTVQTLNVTDSTGREQTVEYTCIGSGTIYLPRFIALYNVRQMREYLISTQNESPATENLDAQLAEAVGNIPETAEEAEEYIQSAWSGIIDGHGALKLNIFEVSNLTALMENSVYDGSVTITTERTDNKLSITLESPAEDTWVEIFDIDESLAEYVEEAQSAVELALRDADIPESEWTLSLDGMVQAALFVYFEGFFELPVDRSEIAAGTNGIVNQLGETSRIHKYNYGGVQHDLPEDGVTLWLENGSVPVYANLLNCGDCIQYAYIYDVWDMENGGHAASADVTSKVLNYSAVTIAYVIDTNQFEKDYGFPFPVIDEVTSNGTITLFVEYSCLSRLDGISEDAIGEDLFDISDGSIRIGYSHGGRTDTSRDFITGTNTYYHSFPVGEEIPHVTIKTSFMSGEVSQPQYSAPHYYRGLSAADLGVEVNPRLWFKGFRSNVDDELFRTIVAVEP